jgi:glycerophosphoryl diester phosphodiesterase
MLIIAHRGASGLEPENTIRSFKKAEQIGVDMIELDVRSTREGELVISHDATLKRIFGTGQSISQMSLKQIKEVSIAAGREIPTLDEVIENINCDIDIDVKVHGIEKQLMAKLKKFSHKVLISSIYPGVLKKIRALDEKVNLGLIVGRGELHLLPILNRLAKNLNLYSIHPKYMIVYKSSIAVLRQTKRKIFVWTVNEPHEYERVAQLGVDGIITDCPHLFKK